ncbi:MAG: type II secretion system protein [Synergistaceae bacterium]|nr:type II secretion system protein [Synergistaceae bacterium]
MRLIKKRYDRRRAFVLVELLTVIIIIGVLAGLLMAAASPAIRKAEDVRAVNDINLIRRAIALATYNMPRLSEVYISTMNGDVEVTGSGLSAAQKEAIRSAIKNAFDTEISGRRFSILYDADGKLATLSYFPGDGSYPWYYISALYNNDMSIYCYDSRSSSPRLVKSYK